MSPWLDHRESKYLIKHYSGCLWGCFSMRLTLESIDYLKQIALPVCVSSTQSVNGLSRTKRQNKREFTLLVWMSSSWDNGFLLSEDSGSALLVLRPLRKGLQNSDWNCTINSLDVFSLPTANLETSASIIHALFLYNKAHFYLSLFPSLPRPLLFILFLWNGLILPTYHTIFEWGLHL